MESGDGHRDAREAPEDRPQRPDGVPIPPGQPHRRIAYCECGAPLSGDSERQLFEAAEAHLARHHPQLLGALERGLVAQMAENTGG